MTIFKMVYAIFFARDQQKYFRFEPVAGNLLLLGFMQLMQYLSNSVCFDIASFFE